MTPRDEFEEEIEGEDTEAKRKKPMSRKTRNAIAGVVLAVGTVAAAALGGPWATAILFGADVASDAIKNGGKEGKTGKSGKVGKTGKVEAVEVEIVEVTDCTKAKNTCRDYSIYWQESCPAGVRCLEFKNSCSQDVELAYQIGCNGDGTKGAPQCDCTNGPVLAAGSSAFFEILDGSYTSCLPSWKPACLTAGLQVTGNYGTASCTEGTRIEFTAGNKLDPYGAFDSYDVDVELSFSVPVGYSPDLTCAHDTANHDCRPLWCDSATCPDAYSSPTSGGCPDGRSPQAGCQDTFGGNEGYTVTFCPASGTPCADATPCSEELK
jgi:hypothetical protein